MLLACVFFFAENEQVLTQLSEHLITKYLHLLGILQQEPEEEKVYKLFFFL